MNEEQMKNLMAQFATQMGTIVNNAISEYDKKRKEEEAEAKAKAEKKSSK